MVGNHSKLRKTGGARIKVNIVARSCNHRWRRKAISITYSELVLLVLVIQHAKSMHHADICSLPGNKIFFQIISQAARFFKKG